MSEDHTIGLLLETSFKATQSLWQNIFYVYEMCQWCKFQDAISPRPEDKLRTNLEIIRINYSN